MIFTFTGDAGDLELLKKVGAGQISIVETTTGAATSGAFTLAYGGETTAALAFDATAAQVQTAFTALPSIGSLTTVAFSTGDAACAAGPGVGMVVTFGGEPQFVNASSWPECAAGTYGPACVPCAAGTFKAAASKAP